MAKPSLGVLVLIANITNEPRFLERRRLSKLIDAHGCLGVHIQCDQGLYIKGGIQDLQWNPVDRFIPTEKQG